MEYVGYLNEKLNNKSMLNKQIYQFILPCVSSSSPLQFIFLSVSSNSCSCGCISDRPIHIATVAAAMSGSVKSGEEAIAIAE